MSQFDTHDITCPYCFFKFRHNQVVFRANTGFSQSELDTGEGSFGGGLLGSRGADKKKNNDPRALFRKFDDENSFATDKKLDNQLITFWKERGGSSGYVNVDKHWDYPHIDPASPDFFQMIRTEPTANLTPDADGFIRDQDGFVTRVVDRFSDPLIPMARLCPNCHNPLPLPNYGKYPVIFISVVGVTGSGKTVYLNQLLTRFSDVVDCTGYHVGTNNLESVGESVCPGSPLPGSTDDKTMRRPLAVNLLRDNPTPEDAGLTIVFYDIAGENCVNKQGDPDAARAKSTVGHFIAFCDGLIFLIDPEQIPPFATGAKARPSNIGSVVNVMAEIRENMNRDEPTWTDIPVAVTIAKSDKLRNCAAINRDNPIFTYSNEQVKGYDREENLEIDDFLRTFLNANANAVVAPLNSFRRRSYFAVSAITCGVESRFEKYQNEYILDVENENKFQALRRWVDGWNQRTPENRAHYPRCSVLCHDGSELSFPVDEMITQQNADGLIMDIRADSTDADSIYLDLWDVAARMNLTGYPVADPAPRRVGDPLKWTLWKRGVIGPFFEESPMPKKPFLVSKRRWEQMLEEWEYANQVDRAKFYGDYLED